MFAAAGADIDYLLALVESLTGPLPEPEPEPEHALTRKDGGWGCTVCEWRAADYAGHLAQQFWTGVHTPVAA